MGRWIALRALAFGLRRKLCAEEALEAIMRAFPRKTPAWRLELLSEAQARAAR
jgi:hypothetical protein